MSKTIPLNMLTEKIILKARQRRVNFWFGQGTRPETCYWMLWAFENKSETKGLGKYWLLKCLIVADMYNCPVSLFTYNAKLVKYYQKLGFKVLDYTGNPYMVREPRPVKETKRKLIEISRLLQSTKETF